jgi:hypothetical protein
MHRTFDPSIAFVLQEVRAEGRRWPHAQAGRNAAPGRPEQSPLTIEPIDDWSPEKARAAWESLQARLKEHPIHGGGRRYTRDELHERR